MGRGRPGACLAGAGLENDDGGPARGFAHDLQELLPVDDIFKVAEHDLAVVVVRRVTDEVNFVEIRLVAQADEFAETDAFSQAPVEDRQAQGPALGEKRDLALEREVLGEGGVERSVRVYHAEAVGPDHAHPVAPADLHELSLALQPL